MDALWVAFPAVLFVVDPIGVVPIFVAMTTKSSREKCLSTARTACLTAGSLLIFFALFGGFIFRMFGVSLAAFRVAGGLVLILTALDMLRAKPASTRTSPEETNEGMEQDDIAIVPLAMPLLAGPGALATVMTLMGQYGNTVDGAASVLVSILLTSAIAYLVLRSANVIRRVLRATGIAILERVFGLILAAVAVQFVFEGGRALLER